MALISCTYSDHRSHNAGLGFDEIDVQAVLCCYDGMAVNNIVCRAGAWVGCDVSSPGVGGPTARSGTGYIVVLQILGTPMSLSVPPLPATPPASAL